MYQWAARGIAALAFVVAPSVAAAQSSACQQWQALIQEAPAGFPSYRHTGGSTFRAPISGWSDCAWVGDPSTGASTLFECNRPAGVDPRQAASRIAAELQACFPAAQFYRPSETGQTIIIPNLAEIGLVWGEDTRWSMISNETHLALIVSAPGGRRGIPQPRQRTTLLGTAPVMLDCDLTEDWLSESATGRDYRPQFRTVRRRFAVSDTSFRIFDDRTQTWSANYCRPEDPGDSVSCVQNSNSALWYWEDYPGEDIAATAERRGANIVFQVKNHYYIDFSGQETVMSFRVDKRTYQIQYYGLTDSGLRDNTQRPNENWASYRTSLGGRGTCVLVRESG